MGYGIFVFGLCVLFFGLGMMQGQRTECKAWTDTAKMKDKMMKVGNFYYVVESWAPGIKVETRVPRIEEPVEKFSFEKFEIPLDKVGVIGDKGNEKNQTRI